MPVHSKEKVSKMDVEKEVDLQAEKIASLKIRKNSGQRKTCLLLDLDDDCLLEIMGYVQRDDMLALRKTNTRFLPLFSIAAKHRKDSFKLDKETLKKLPVATSLDTYKVIGQLTTNLDVKNIDEQILIQLLPLFPRIDDLDLESGKVRDIRAIGTFPMPKRLRFVAKNTSNVYLKALLQRFAPRLEDLDCSDDPSVEFEALPTLKSLTINFARLSSKCSYWTNDKIKLEDLTVVYEEEQGEDLDLASIRRNLQEIAQIMTLTKISLGEFGYDILPSEIVPQFPYVTDVALDFAEQECIFAVLDKFSPQVKRIAIDFVEKYEEEDLEIWEAVIKFIAQRFPQLEALHFRYFTEFSVFHMRPLFGMKTLKELWFTGTSSLVYLAVAKAMPQLERMMSFDDESPIATPQFIEFLKKENRKMVVDYHVHLP